MECLLSESMDIQILLEITTWTKKNDPLNTGIQIQDEIDSTINFAIFSITIIINK